MKNASMWFAIPTCTTFFHIGIILLVVAFYRDFEAHISSKHLIKFAGILADDFMNHMNAMAASLNIWIFFNFRPAQFETFSRVHRV